MPDDGAQRAVAVEPLDVPRQLLHAVDLTAALDLDGDRPPVGVAAEQVDRADVGRVLAAHEHKALGEDVRRGGQQLLEVGLDAVLRQTRVGSELVGHVAQHRLECDDQPLAGGVRDDPLAGLLPAGVRRVHPVQRLVRAAVGVDRDAAVGLHQDEADGARQVSGQPSLVVDGALSDDQPHAPNVAAVPVPSGTVFERFTDRARQVVVLAQEESRRLGHSYIGTEHLLLALGTQSDSVAGEVLADFGITRDALRVDVEARVGRGTGVPPGHIPFTPESKKVLELALREALQLGHNYIGTEHLLLGLVRVRDCLGTQLLVARGVDLDGLRAAVLGRIESAATEPPRRRAKTAPTLDRCSFCGRPQPAVAVLLSGLGDARICDRCVAAAARLVEESGSLPNGPSGPGPTATPA